MSATSAERPAAPAGAAPPIPCPRCGSEIRGDQGWCVECGLAGRTRMAPPPDWRVPAIVAAGIGLAAIVALIIAFAVLTSHNQPVAPAATAPVTPTPTPDTAPAVTPTTAAPATILPATAPPSASTPTAPATTAPAPTPTP